MGREQAQENHDRRGNQRAHQRTCVATASRRGSVRTQRHPEGDVVTEQVAAMLGVSPEQLDPGYGESGFDDGD